MKELEDFFNFIIYIQEQQSKGTKKLLKPSWPIEIQTLKMKYSSKLHLQGTDSLLQVLYY